MKKEKTLMLLVLGLVVLMAGAFVLYNKLLPDNAPDLLASSPSSQASEKQNEPAPESEPDYSAPDFTVVDGDGNEVKLSDFFGKPIVLNFWASWCGPCKIEMPDFQAKYEEYGEKIQFLMVNLTDGRQETVESARSYIDGVGYTFPVYFDTELSAAIAYGVSAIPATYFIDEHGVLVAYGKSALSAEKLQTGIDVVLK